MLESTVRSKGQTTLPAPVRNALSIKPGDRVRYIIHGDQVRIIKTVPLTKLKGLLPYDGPPVSLEEMEQAIADGACGR